LDKTYVRGEGCYLFDAGGIGYADCIAQFGAVPFGHDPEPIWQAIESVRRERLPNLAITSIPAVQGELAERLLAMAPPGLAHVVFTNSGAESVEAAIKLARVRTGRIGIMAATSAFHGLTLAGMSATDTAAFQRGFGAPAPGFHVMPFGDLAALRAALAARPGYFAAFLVEIIQGESGIRVAPPGYIAAARDLCHEHGALLIVDEVQTGLGRTGSLFASESEAVTPDILCLAKALGGGLMPIGACLYTSAAYSEQFDLRHGSTFAGNALSCRAALATLDLLTADDRKLVRRVASMGERLLKRLQALQSEFPALVKDVRGRGLMIGIELNLDQITETQNGLLAILQEQGLLLYAAVSYLLNVEHIRMAPSFTHGAVLRIEPPLIADEAFCDDVVSGIARLLQVIKRGATNELIGHLMRQEPAVQTKATGPRRDGLAARLTQNFAPQDRTRFAFIVHLLELADMRRLDPTLDGFANEEIEGMKTRFGDFISCFPHGELAIPSQHGRLAEGEMIVLPQLPSDLMSLPPDDAVDLVQEAIDLAASRGAEVIGLAGFSSIVTYGGLAIKPPKRVRVTSGNSYTAFASTHAVERACAARGILPADCTVAVVGAAGVIGQALSLLWAERARELILLGNPRGTDQGAGRLQLVAQTCARRAATRRENRGDPIVTVSTDIDRDMPKAHIVFTATNAVLPFIAPRHLRADALICDVSRPFNVVPGLRERRPDVHWVDGGLVRAPQSSVLGFMEEVGRPLILPACAAETIILALSGFRSEHFCGPIDLMTLSEIGAIATRMGFSSTG
jgi:acetylornithine/succinyldiaminopimelate/putrescine aminotransferase/predicted amino acid dehydrogenase